MIKNGILIVILLIVGVLFVTLLRKYTKEFHSSSEQTNVSIKDPPSPRFPASNFTLSDLKGNTIQLSEFRGSVVLILFWTTW